MGGFSRQQLPHVRSQLTESAIRGAAMTANCPAHMTTRDPVQGAQVGGRRGTSLALAPLPPAHAGNNPAHGMDERMPPLNIRATPHRLVLPTLKESRRIRRVSFKCRDLPVGDPANHLPERQIDGVNVWCGGRWFSTISELSLSLRISDSRSCPGTWCRSDVPWWAGPPVRLRWLAG